MQDIPLTCGRLARCEMLDVLEGEGEGQRSPCVHGSERKGSSISHWIKFAAKAFQRRGGPCVREACQQMLHSHLAYFC